MDDNETDDGSTRDHADTRDAGTRDVAGTPADELRIEVDVEVTALAINVDIPDALRWTDTRRGEEFVLSSLNVRLLPDSHLAAKAYGRPVGGGRGTYVSFPVPHSDALDRLVRDAATRAAQLWAGSRGVRRSSATAERT